MRAINSFLKVTTKFNQTYVREFSIKLGLSKVPPPSCFPPPRRREPYSAGLRWLVSSRILRKRSKRCNRLHVALNYATPKLRTQFSHVALAHRRRKGERTIPRASIHPKQVEKSRVTATRSKWSADNPRTKETRKSGGQTTARCRCTIRVKEMTQHANQVNRRIDISPIPARR